MSLLDRQANALYGKEPLEDTGGAPVTQAQLNYIEILSNKLNFSLQTRNTHIESIIGHSNHTRGALVKRFDIWLLSKVEAGKVIGQFKKWIEERGS